jgi:hypothetical protein
VSAETIPWIFDKEHLGLSKRQEYVFQQDGATAHWSKSTMQWLRTHLPLNLSTLEKGEWPARSCDLSIIERLWAIISNRVVERGVQTCEELKDVIDQEWWAIPQSTIQKLYDSLPERLEQCIKNEGGRFEH